VDIDNQAVSEQLEFVRLDTTTPDDFLQHFGKPHDLYEDGRIIVYEMCVTLDRKLASSGRSKGICGNPEDLTERFAGYQLVLVFSRKNILEKYSLVRVR
jgi:hypothetical protein